MFTGIIQQVGRVTGRGPSRLEVAARLGRVKAGDSVAVNGACLTVVPPLKAGRLAFDVSAETWSRTNLGGLAKGMPVNLEPSLRLGEGLGGHLVSGHIDAAGSVLAVERLPGGFVRFRASLPALRGLTPVKGSVAIDGVSLTVTATGPAWVETVLVPHTLENTNLGGRKSGDPVNLEADLVARYLRGILEESGAVRGRGA